MSDNVRPPSTIAQPPFDDVNADIVFHTSDHVDFRIFRLILTLSSPFFQGMFSLPQPSDTSSPSAVTATRTTNGTPEKTPPTVDVPEDSHTLDALLRFLYPNTHTPMFRNLTHARRVALAASKYHLVVALDKIAHQVKARYVTEHPLEVYLFACQMGWEAVARAAARGCLDPVRVFGEHGERGREEDADVLGYPGAGIAYHRLEAYRYACRRALEQQLNDMGLFDDEGTCGRGADSEDEGGDNAGISSDCLSRWTAQYLANIKLAVLKCPRKETLDDMSLTPDLSCSHCDIDKADTIAAARLEVASKVESVLSQVRWAIGTNDANPLTKLLGQTSLWSLISARWIRFGGSYDRLVSFHPRIHIHVFTTHLLHQNGRAFLYNTQKPCFVDTNKVSFV